VGLQFGQYHTLAILPMGKGLNWPECDDKTEKSQLLPETEH